MALTNIVKIIFISLLILCNGVSAEQGDWLLRARGIGITPNDDSSLISLDGTNLTGSSVSVSTQVVPELDITYMLRDNIGIELIAAVANHDIKLQGPGAALSGLGLTNGFKLADTWVLPPTVTLQYHFAPESNIRPYLGAGVNFTAFFSDSASSDLEAAIGPVDVSSNNSWGWAAQAGVDIGINDRWFLNLDIKYIDMNTHATLGTALGTLAVDVDVDPFILGLGIGYRF
jgi:outer membrane protein